MENNKIYIGIIVTLTLTAAGVGGYFLWKKKKEESAGAGSGGTTTAPAIPSEATPSSGASTEIKVEDIKKQSDNTGIAPPKITGAKSCSAVVYLAGDKTWEYRKCDTFWQTRKKGSTGQWISLANNKQAASKLDAAFPKI